MKVLGIIYNDYFLFSRAIHDFRWLNESQEIAIDGGQPYQSGYIRVVGKIEKAKTAWAELDCSSSEAYNDWKFAKDRLGIHKLDEVEIINDVDVDSLEYRADHYLWRDVDERINNFHELETDHLNNLLEFAPNHSDIINYILEIRTLKRKIFGE